MAHVVAFVPARSTGFTTADLAREMAIHPEAFNLVDHYGSTLVLWKREPLPGERVLILTAGRKRQAICQSVRERLLTCRLRRSRHIQIGREDCLGVICERRKRFCGATAA